MPCRAESLIVEGFFGVYLIPGSPFCLVFIVITLIMMNSLGINECVISACVRTFSSVNH